MKNTLREITLPSLVFTLVFSAISIKAQVTTTHQDRPYIQDYSIKYTPADKTVKLQNVVSDRNGYIQLFSSKGLLRTRAGEFLFPGTLVTDVQDRQTSDKKIAGVGTYENQLVYIDDKAVFSNAWAGRLYSRHSMPGARIFAGGKDFQFLISDGKWLSLIKDSQILWEGSLPGEEVKDIKFDAANNLFWILGSGSVSKFSPGKKEFTKVIDGNNLSCLSPVSGKLIVGTSDGYFKFDIKTNKQNDLVHNKMPWADLTTINEIDGKLWFGSTNGAMMLREDGKFDYFASKRWLPSDSVIRIAKGPENSVLILTTGGLGKICFPRMTLHEKALFFEKQVRERHIRTGFNATVSGMINGDVTTGSMEDSDNDGLWTSMYLGGEAFRYAVTKSDDALQNVREALDAMERLYTISKIPGFPGRSFERRGYKFEDEAWRRADDPEWDWKSTTSSDEAIGHIFAFGAIAEVVDVPELRDKAIMLIDTLMAHIVKNNLYMITWNGKPTKWGRWHPDYVNAYSKYMGDRKINSSNIIAMLQTAYHFTHRELYKQKAFELMDKFGYLENLMRPMREITPAPEGSSQVIKDLSDDHWNHSDDEMYFLGYWGLYRYAFNDSLKAKYKEAILDHWQIERPEKEGAWNIFTALTGVKEFDLNEGIWYLQRYPLDLINWTVMNSYRKDIEKLEPNFRNRTVKEVLPPDELPIERHNGNRFGLDGQGNGGSEYSAGDIWLLPYWMGRYLGVISAPVKKNEGTKE